MCGKENKRCSRAATLLRSSIFPHTSVLSLIPLPYLVDSEDYKAELTSSLTATWATAKKYQRGPR